ncbi:SDR family NAD(P)-dependent oxidoreductase [Congregibacter variabilis]|uniref:SDR family NAD(P)-dependent oxidoreductase n=1 Tax=Congregibacter variabilis TaxID=3081200 RepID=A0ABZ0I821_9GAMM|nr:SDR family NAD(P)-dependent oxidoreductase [Congregibacter sp. IMCC43200]
MSTAKEKLAGKVALVTGAASGIGEASARKLSAEGAALVLSDINEAGAAAVASELVAAGGKAISSQHDVRQPQDWERVLAITIENFGGLDILVNNAGIAADNTELMKLELDQWHKVTSINLDGVFLGMRYAGPALEQRGGGSVINISSILGKVGFPGAAAYCASKGGVSLLTKSAALEWAPLNIRVNSVHPGFVETPLVIEALQNDDDGVAVRELLVAAHPLGRLGQAQEIANAVAFLASDESSFMTGSELVIDGGYTAQ